MIVYAPGSFLCKNWAHEYTTPVILFYSQTVTMSEDLQMVNKNLRTAYHLCVAVKIGVVAGESVEGWSYFVVHIRGWNGEEGASHGNDNVENRDENDMMNLPESIHICPCWINNLTTT
jgi:hypothetical protein